MESNLQALPPLKRFRLMQQQAKDHSDGDASYRLPAKKRKESRATTTVADEPASYWLPAKKRVWALPPTLSPIKKPSLFDLNLEYAPSPEDEKQDFVEKEQKFPDGCGGYRSEEAPKDIQDQQEDKSPDGFEDNRCDGALKQEKDEEGEEKVQSIDAAIEEKDDDEEEIDDGIVCSICQSTDGDPSDPIVLCDGCDLMVHATCLGNPLLEGIPEGDWFCSQCLAFQSEKKEVLSCCLCPVKGGALKPTNDGRWAHVVCALLVPEVFFEDPEGRDAIDCSRVPPKRWEQACYLCSSACGCVIDCSERKCPLAFHVTCGLKQDFCIEYMQVKKNRSAIVAGFCKSHTELWKKQQETGKFRIVAREEHRG